MKKYLSFLVIIFISTNLSASAEIISYEAILTDALANSYTLKKNAIDLKLSKEQRKTVKSEYFPNLSAGLNTQYDRDLTGGTAQITSVGDTILLDSSRYQNSAGLNLSYTVFDFGTRKRKLQIANKDIEQKKVIYDKELRDIKLNLLNLYGEALLAYKEIKNRESTFVLQKEVFNIREALFNEGKSSKIEVATEAITMAKIVSHIDNLKNKLDKNLNDLSYYTHKDYSIKDIELTDFQEENIVPINDVKEGSDFNLQANFDITLEKTPEFRLYEIAIAKKQKELEIIKRQMLPQLAFRTSYSFYGSNPDDFFDSIGDIADRNLSFRLFTQIPLFDGLKNKSEQNKVKFEIEKLKVEKEEKIFGVKKEFEKIEREQGYLQDELKNNEKTLVLAQDSYDMSKRLDDERLIDKISFLKQKSALIEQNMEIELNKVRNKLAKYKLKTLSEVGE